MCLNFSFSANNLYMYILLFYLLYAHKASFYAPIKIMWQWKSTNTEWAYKGRNMPSWGPLLGFKLVMQVNAEETVIRKMSHCSIQKKQIYSGKTNCTQRKQMKKSCCGFWLSSWTHQLQYRLTSVCLKVFCKKPIASKEGFQ